ncbi:hypothetical protein [uncultured Clostridium sp.]|jgi:hypothetical protein|uniref:hypothetical protein n=1 Tax=uncultured Clostridium sp. TaxID=59620 RepID=UPI002612B104|nr:hypothetical protein [uncultured Clostridium sp.]
MINLNKSQLTKKNLIIIGIYILIPILLLINTLGTMQYSMTITNTVSIFIVIAYIISLFTNLKKALKLNIICDVLTTFAILLNSAGLFFLTSFCILISTVLILLNLYLVLNYLGLFNPKSKIAIIIFIVLVILTTIIAHFSFNVRTANNEKYTTYINAHKVVIVKATPKPEPKPKVVAPKPVIKPAPVAIKTVGAVTTNNASSKSTDKSSFSGIKPDKSTAQASNSSSTANGNNSNSSSTNSASQSSQTTTSKAPVDTNTNTQTDNSSSTTSSNTDSSNSSNTPSDSDNSTSNSNTPSNSSSSDNSDSNGSSNSDTSNNGGRPSNYSSSSDSSSDSTSSQSATANAGYESENVGDGYGIIKQLGDGYLEARLHSAPSAHSSYSEDLAGGTKVKILNDDSYYYYVQAPDGSKGYVFDHYITQN